MEESESLVNSAIAPEHPIEVRPLRSHEDYAACVRLQQLTWGDDYNEIVPPIILKITQKVGGVSAGAFDASGRMLACVYGMTGVEGGRLVHWSHMLAVVPEARDLGIGRRLKEYQRDRLLPLGVEVMYWTFDPLVARNAHLNLVRLGAEVVEYVRDMYGRTESALHALGTDRFVVGWRLGGGPVGANGARGEPGVAFPGDVGYRTIPLIEPTPSAPIVNRGPDGGPAPATQPLPEASLVRIEIPADIEAVRQGSLELARRWQASVQRSFLNYLERGYRVVGFQRGLEGERCHYLLSGPGAGATHAAGC